MPVVALRDYGCLALLLCGLAAVHAQERPSYPFSRDRLVALAEELATKQHVPRELDKDSALRRLSYDQYRAIEFQRAASIWRGEERGFTVDLLHPGFLFTTSVDINLVVEGISRRVLYTTDVFNYGLDTAPMREVEAPGYSGFRVAAPINGPERLDEFLLFQGASYLRAVGRGQRYGLSARGLAINTARPEGEEFPAFTEFWIERPPRNAERIVIHALLESRSITGAFTFTAAAGSPTTIAVDATLFPRSDVTAYGIAPLTSMFLFDGTNRGRFDDFRPAVHDSDGLSILGRNKELIWRPLANPVALQVSAFDVEGLKGFGLMQRDRDFADFEDIEARYELRPSVWVEPVGEWAPGHVELIEIPSDAEIHDNVVAFWQPDQPLRAGRRYDFVYRMSWGNLHPPAQVAGALIADTLAGKAPRSGARRFVIDFAPNAVPENPKLRVLASAGRVLDARGSIVAATGAYRASFLFDPEGADLAELRMEVSSNGKRWGETWLYRWTR